MSDDFRILEGLLRFTNRRHGLIASNIANADTPEYRIRDVRFEQGLDVATFGLKTTDPGHVKAGENMAAPDIVTVDSQPWAEGNHVELDLEVAKMTENALVHQAGLT